MNLNTVKHRVHRVRLSHLFRVIQFQFLLQFSFLTSSLCLIQDPVDLKHKARCLKSNPLLGSSSSLLMSRRWLWVRRSSELWVSGQLKHPDAPVVTNWSLHSRSGWWRADVWCFLPDKYSVFADRFILR